MGRAFEYRRARKEKRWDWMAKTFTKYGKEISMSVRQGGPDPETNPRLRLAIQNAKGANMPKDRIESAIKRASSKDEKDYLEMVYEGYGPHGVAIVVECATENNTRTVANVRYYFSKWGGALGTTGSLDFMFERKGVFTFLPGDLEMDTLELTLIDSGAEDIITNEDGTITVLTRFTDFGTMNKALEELGVEVTNAEAQRIPVSTKELTPEQEEEVMVLIEKIEEDEDVQQVYHNLA